MVLGRHEASHPRGWDSTEEGTPTMGKGEQVCASQQVLNFELAKGKEKFALMQTRQWAHN